MLIYVNMQHSLPGPGPGHGGLIQATSLILCYV